jgi:polysaccharide pyruvyl transferase WcaK-like protein
VQAPLALRSRRSWAPHYARSLERAECIVIGGGNLIADLDLNFPTKIALAVEAAWQRSLPVFIYGCGASAGWSRQGRALLEGAVRRGVIRKVWVRDERSRGVWNDLIGQSAGLEAALARDPGLLARERYGIERRGPTAHAPVIGLNLTSPLAVRYHSDSPSSAADLERWYVEFAASLLLRGYSLAIFTNGSPEDRACLKKLRSRFEVLDPGGRIMFPEAHTPAELTALVAGCEAIAAFRMHAIIAAYSCGVPFLALSWDPKLDSFLQSVNLSDRLCTPVTTIGPDAARQLGWAIEQGICPKERAKVIAEARLGVTDLYGEIVGALA